MAMRQVQSGEYENGRPEAPSIAMALSTTLCELLSMMTCRSLSLSKTTCHPVVDN